MEYVLNVDPSLNKPVVEVDRYVHLAPNADLKEAVASLTAVRAKAVSGDRGPKLHVVEGGAQATPGRGLPEMEHGRLLTENSECVPCG